MSNSLDRLSTVLNPNDRGDQRFFYNQTVAEYCGVGFWPDPLIQTQEIEWIVGVQAGLIPEA